MYQQKSQPLLPQILVFRRALIPIGFSAGLFIISAGIGIEGYRIFEGSSGLDSFLNAAMILSGMGIEDKPLTDSAKMFVSIYGLLLAVLFGAGARIILAPFVHRVLHPLHLQETNDNQ